MPVPEGSLRIVLVEDSEVHIRMVKAAVGGWGGPVELRVIRAGAEAVDDLERGVLADPQYGSQLFLLDLGVPGVGGLEFLAALRNVDALRHVPVIVLTASNDPGDVLAAYRAGANAFVHKPDDLGAFIEAMHKTLVFWTEVATLARLEAA